MELVDGAGTYLIRCRVNGKVYAGGSTVSVLKRKIHHFQSLRAGRHYSKRMQNDFDSYGEGESIFEVVSLTCGESIIADERKLIEQLDATNPECGYNTEKAPRKGAGQPKKAKHMKAIVIAVSLKPEHEKKLREIMKATGLDRSKAVQWLIENWQR
jgi:hypothetical protein